MKLPEGVVQVNSDVFRVSTGSFALQDWDFLVAALPHSSRNRVRLCVHAGDDSILQEMFIVLGQSTYIRPHRHPSKAEGFHILEGQARLLFFDEHGSITRAYWGSPAQTRYLHVREPVFHCQLIETPYLVVHETTSGPFSPAANEFAPWAPAEGDPGVADYVARLRQQSDALLGSTDQ